MQTRRNVQRLTLLVASALLALLVSISCSSGPPGRMPPILVEGSSEPAPGTGGTTVSGTSRASDAQEPGPDCGAGEQEDAGPLVSACTALAQCCSRFAIEDPAQGWCEESLTQADGPDRCSQMLAFWGC